jgi:hypothetical protein
MLDTLMNVVGILVIVLVAVQISSQEAASRIVESMSKIDPEEVARLEKAAATAKEQVATATAEIEAQRQAIMNPKAELSRLQAALQIEEDSAREAGQRASAIETQHAAAIATAREAADRAAAERTRMDKEAKAVETRLVAMRRELEALPVLEAPPAKAVRLPDPRPAPEGVSEIPVLCREERIWIVDIDSVREKALRRAEFVIRSKKLDPDNDRWLAGGMTFIDEFNKVPVKEGAFEVSLELINDKWPRMVLGRIQGRGETADDAVKATGDFARMLRRVTPETHVLRFFVWPDAFEAYLTVREFTGERGFAAGWEPMTTPTEYSDSLTRYAVGVKPPPKPPDPNPKKPAPIPNVLD